ncbi:MAG: TrkA C-terminal domain-containing protein [Candidatus Bathyarchaeota archaeon]|jgi:uncharacterized protein with PhoU and TrkA domain
MPYLEKIEYKPVSVRELFLEMKNLSELMIDLAYSAALFNDKELAEDVLELEKHIDTLTYLLEMEIMIAARDAEDAEALVGVSKVASAANKISDAAADIAAIVTQNIEVHPVVSEGFQKVEERLTRAVIKEDSKLVNRQIEALELEAKMGVNIIAIRRNRDWIINPKNAEQLKIGDILIARGAPFGIKEFKGLAESGETKRRARLIGNHRKFEEIVKRFVELKDTSELMIDLAYSSLLLNSKELAEDVQRLEEHVDKLHTEFELLVLSSGVKPKKSKQFLGLIRLGVVTEEIADAAAEIAEVVLRDIPPHPVLKIAIEEAEETVTYSQVAKDSVLVKKTLRDIRIPEETGMWVLAIRRNGRYIRPKPSTKIEANDVLIASGYAEGEDDLKDLASH